MHQLQLIICVLFVVLMCKGDCARILGIVPTPSYSHQIVFQPIFKELSLRGHQVTTITTNPIKNPILTNLTEIDLHASYNIWNKKVAQLTNGNIISFLISLIDLMEEVGHYQFSHPDVHELINTKTKVFDVVMAEYRDTPAFVFAKKFKAPLIMITSFDAFSDLREIMGCPTHPILYPDPITPHYENPSLTNRLQMVFLKLIYSGIKKYYVVRRQQAFVDKYFGKNYPPVEELAKDVSLVLANSDLIFHAVKPLVPTVVLFGGGSHRTPPKPLPTELKHILDKAQNGFVYFSLGSNVKSKDLSESTRKIIMQAFEELPYTVLWKFESDDLPNKPKNVITCKWLPQQDILKHPNIKLFITQGGLQSTEEAIYDHVPMLGMPFFGDQEFNVNKMVKMGFGLGINYRTMNKDEFKQAIFDVITNPKFKEKIVKLSNLAQDQPMTGLERAIWWTEYVIRHNGTRHLRSPLLDIPFYQYYLLDVMAIFVIVFFVLIYIIISISKLLIKLVVKVRSVNKTKVN